MDWLQDMTARWVRMMCAASEGGTPLDEAVRQISLIIEPPAAKSRFGRMKRNASGPAGVPAVTVLCRQLIASVLVSDLMTGRLCELAGQTREQVLDQLTADLPRQLPDHQLGALLDELSASCALLHSPGRLTYTGLGARIEHLLRLAEEQAADLVAAARAEAAEIVSSAGGQGARSTPPELHAMNPARAAGSGQP